MTIKYYKPLFEKIQTYIPRSITPNSITIANFLLLIYFYNSDLYKNPKLFSLFIFIFTILDGVDGIHARATNQQSKLGEILDHGLDPVRNIILITLLFKLFKIPDTYKNIILILFILNNNIFHLVAKYTKKYSYGTKYFSVDDASVVLMILPLLTLIKLPKINNNIFYVFCAILLFYALYQIKLLKNYNVSKTDILIFLIVNYLSYLHTNNMTNLLLINFLYPVYTIYNK
jgi:phosphatidylglycerophosphate synthase